MELRRTLVLSIVVHFTFFVAVMTIIAGRGARTAMPISVIRVTLLSEAISPISEKSVRHAPRASAGDMAAPLPAIRRAKAFSKAKEPLSIAKKVDESPKEKDSPFAAGTRPAESIPSAGFTTISGGNAWENIPWLQSDTGNSGRDEAESTAGPETLKNVRRHPDAAAGIRHAIEQATRYPLSARKRGIEGTATAEFTINSRGYPEDVKIIRSSGSDILDKAAKETVLRASPFPVVSGSIEIPITFRLKRHD